MLIPSSEIQLNRGIGYVADTGAVNVYVATVVPAIFSLTTGISIDVKISATNTSTTPTLNVNSLGAKTIVRNDTGGALLAGDLQIGATHRFLYDGTNWRLINPRFVGQIAQVVYGSSGVMATGATTIPADDTIPQNTEGDEYMTLAITPTRATNKLFIEIQASLGTTIATPTTMTVALFQDTTANALAALGKYIQGPTGPSFNQYFLSWQMVSGTTSATTFKFRAGASVAGTTTFNGLNGARLYGGVMASYIRITEIQV